MKRPSPYRVLGLLLTALSLLAAGCAEPTSMALQDTKNLPKWVTQKGAAFSGEKRVFYGVGSAAALQNPALRRRAAEGQARRDIAQTMQTYVAALQKQYMSETTAGDMSKQSVEQQVTDTMKQVTDATLVGSQIVEYWEHPTRNEAYALARLDLEQFLDVMKSYHAAAGQSKELDAKVREYVQKNAAKAYDELNAEQTRPSQLSKYEVTTPPRTGVGGVCEDKISDCVADVCAQLVKREREGEQGLVSACIVNCCKKTDCPNAELCDGGGR